MGIQLRELAAWARNRKIMATMLMTMTLAIGMLIGTVISGHVGAAHPALGSDATPLAIPDPVQLSSAFASIVSKVQPAVVNISTTQVIERGKQGSGIQRNRDDRARRMIRTNSHSRIFSIVSSIFPNRGRQQSAAWARA